MICTYEEFLLLKIHKNLTDFVSAVQSAVCMHRHVLQFYPFLIYLKVSFFFPSSY